MTTNQTACQCGPCEKCGNERGSLLHAIAAASGKDSATRHFWRGDSSGCPVHGSENMIQQSPASAEAAAPDVRVTVERLAREFRNSEPDETQIEGGDPNYSSFVDGWEAAAEYAAKRIEQAFSRTYARQQPDAVAEQRDPRDVCAIRGCEDVANSMTGGIGPLCDEHYALIHPEQPDAVDVLRELEWYTPLGEDMPHGVCVVCDGLEPNCVYEGSTERFVACRNIPHGHADDCRLVAALRGGQQ